MTVFERIKQLTAEEVAEIAASMKYGKVGTNLTSSDYALGSIFYDNKWDDDNCPDTCQHLEQGWSYEDEWCNGMCDLGSSFEDAGNRCPYSVSRKKVFKEKLLEAFNKEWKDES